MHNPVIFAVANDEATRGPLAGDLDRRFGADYRIMTTDSATRGIAALARRA
jgi:hypothetical protein